MDDVSAIEQRLARMFEEQMHVAVPTADTDLFETGGMDSLSFVELLLVLDRDFGIHVSLDALELDNFRSITRIARFIADQRQAKRADAVRPIKRG